MIEKILAPAIEAELIALLPELGLPVIKQIVEVVEHVAEDKFTNFAETGVDFIIFDTQTAEENSDMGRALAKLKAAAATGDPAAIAAAQDEYDKAESALVNADGAAPH